MSQPSLRKIDRKLIARVGRRIAEACQPEAVYLFGSAARGEARSGSDLDLLVVMEVSEDTTAREQARKIHSLFEDWLVPMDVVVVTPQEFARGQQLPGHITRVATRQGVRLHG